MEKTATREKTEAEARAGRDRDGVLLAATLKAAAFGEIMSVLLQSPRHAGVTLETIARQMLPAFLTGQYILARGKPDNPEVPAAPVGVVFWASVPDEADRRIEADPSKTVALERDDWQGGDTVWILDVAAAPSVSAALLKCVREKVGPGKTIKIRTAAAGGKAATKIIE